MLKRINLTGNPNLGVYISVNDEVAIVPFNLPTEMEPVMKEVFNKNFHCRMQFEWSSRYWKF